MVGCELVHVTLKLILDSDIRVCLVLRGCLFVQFGWPLNECLFGWFSLAIPWDKKRISCLRLERGFGGCDILYWIGGKFMTISVGVS